MNFDHGKRRRVMASGNQKGGLEEESWAAFSRGPLEPVLEPFLRHLLQVAEAQAPRGWATLTSTKDCGPLTRARFLNLLPERFATEDKPLAQIRGLCLSLAPSVTSYGRACVRM